MQMTQQVQIDLLSIYLSDMPPTKQNIKMNI